MKVNCILVRLVQELPNIFVGSAKRGQKGPKGLIYDYNGKATQESENPSLANTEVDLEMWVEVGHLNICV